MPAQDPPPGTSVANAHVILLANVVDDEEARRGRRRRRRSGPWSRCRRGPRSHRLRFRCGAVEGLHGAAAEPHTLLYPPKPCLECF